MSSEQKPGYQYRFGIGEWYGSLFHRLPADQRRHLADAQFVPRGSRPVRSCPFQSADQGAVPCTKAGGVCSIRLYGRDVSSGFVEVVQGERGGLRIVCPNRFREHGLVPRWVGETLIDCGEPLIVNEVAFLTGITSRGSMAGDVGRIDQVLLAGETRPLRWCALEIQAVYITGRSIRNDFRTIRDHTGPGLPFPPVNHRPDYRSSGPKRLMPQLQMEVPTLRRWGRRMAVVVDQRFFGAMAPMEPVSDVSNCDIAWFMVGLAEDAGAERARLTRGEVHLTTLERAVEGLTAGVPVSREEFEKRILANYRRQQRR